MRPNLLNPLFASLASLPGVGPKLEKLYRRLFGRENEASRLVDLIFHLPTGTVDRRARPKLSEVVPGTIVTVEVTIDRHRPPPPGRSRAPYLIYASDETNDLILTYFNARRDYLERLLPVGERRYVSGTTALYDGHLQMVHPDRVVDEAGFKQLPLVEPVYPLTEGLGANSVRKAVEGALAKLPQLPEWQDAAWLAARPWPAFADAVRTLHRPAVPDDVRPDGAAWSRLAFDEFLAGQLALALVRAHARRLGAHQGERQLTGEELVESKPRPGGAIGPHVVGHGGAMQGAHRVGEGGPRPGREPRGILPFRQLRQFGERAIDRLADRVGAKPFGEGIDRLHQGQLFESRLVDDAVGMHHLQMAVVERGRAGDVAPFADRKEPLQIIPPRVEIGEDKVVRLVARVDEVGCATAAGRRRTVAVDRHLDGNDGAGNDFAQLGARAAIDRARGQMKDEVDEARRLVLTAEQAPVELLELGSDARQAGQRCEQRVEQIWSHRRRFREHAWGAVGGRVSCP